MRPGIFVSRTREKLGRTCDQIGRTLEPWCVLLDGLNTENTFTAGYTLYNCVCDKKKKYRLSFFFQNRYPIMVKCLNIGKPINRSISTFFYSLYNFFKNKTYGHHNPYKNEPWFYSITFSFA